MKKYFVTLFLACTLVLASCGKGANTTGSAGKSDSSAASVTTEKEESKAESAAANAGAAESKDAESGSANSDAGESGTSSDDAAESGAAADGSEAEANVDSSESEAASDDQIPYWTEGSEVMNSLTSFVAEICDESSDQFVPAEDRIAVFDFDGTLYGELYPTYTNEWFFLNLVNNENYYDASDEVKAYTAAAAEAYVNHTELPEKTVSTTKETALAFKGKTVEEYQAVLRKFFDTPTWGFEGMTYAEGFYEPMVAVVKYLTEHDFTCFIVSGSERNYLRELIRGTELSEYIPSHQVIGSIYSLTATGIGDEDPQEYTITEEDEILLNGTLVLKTLETNKIYAIIDEIGKTPVLTFGNSSGDLAMGLYTVKNGGKSYMLLCDDTERDYGNPEKAASFAEKCAELGCETVSMKDDFTTIYKEGVVKVDEEAEALAPAA